MDFDGWAALDVWAAKGDWRKIVAAGDDGRVVVMDFGWGIEALDAMGPDEGGGYDHMQSAMV